VAAVEPLLPALRGSGIAAELFGPTTLLVRSFPAALKRVNWQTFFAGLAASGSGAKAMASLMPRASAVPRPARSYAVP